MAAAAVPDLGGSVAGYSHAFERSLFKPGNGQVAMSDAGYSKLVGANGVFAVDQVTGAVLALPNAGAPSTRRPPFAGSGAEHNAKVKAYFVAGGLPADQIAGVQTHAMMEGGIDAAGNRTPDTLIGYYSVLSRAISGIPVAESYAWARFNVDGEVVDEAVHWPALPASAVAEAKALSVIVGDLPSVAALAAKIEQANPGFGNTEGRVIIHHNLSVDRGGPFSVATYDSTPPNGRSTLHFDRNGARVALRHEVVASSAAVRR
jgi:hypothetical protein